jgi:hypothetical protein
LEEGERHRRKEDGTRQRHDEDLLPKGGERTTTGCSKKEVRSGKEYVFSTLEEHPWLRTSSL